MKTIVISLGGSIVAQEKINISLLKELKKLLDSYNSKFIIVVGGGKPARDYQDAARKLGVEDTEHLDWIGIKATWLNGELVRSMFNVSEQLVTNPTQTPSFDKYLIGAGYKPGWSTDYDAILLAKGFGAEEIINLSNISAVYSEDPAVNPDAEKFSSMTWNQFRNLFGDEWIPGKNVPFDPVGAKEAESSGIKVIVANGKNIANLKNILDGNEFEGTSIE